MEWFIGFSEGNGSILTNHKGKRKQLRFILIQRDRQILDHVKNSLGFGSVCYSLNGNYYRYIVEDYKDIYILTTLFNGNLVSCSHIKRLNE